MKIQTWFKRQWTKLKAWFISVLVALGLITGSLLYAQTVDFSYIPADAYTTGEAMPLSDIQFTRLYCNDVLVAEEAGADSTISADLSAGVHVCYGTHIAGGLESIPSNTVTREVTRGPPNPPELTP